jgi:uncharacterized linocin/CFP29 family protein
MNFLRRQLAPIAESAWPEIEREVQQALTSNLTARKVVDFTGPKGFDFSAVNLGKLTDTQRSEDGVNYGVRRVQPLIEVRVPFQLNIWELDNFSRGADNVDLEPAVLAGLKLAQFEERSVYSGFAPGGIVGLLQLTENAPVSLGGDAQSYVQAVAQAMIVLADRGVAGPYAMVLGAEPYKRLSSDVSNYPPRQRIAKMIEGPILHSRVVEGGFLTSLRGGDFEMTVGQDVSLGYDHHDETSVHLYLTETFTFRVHAAEAVVPLTLG